MIHEVYSTRLCPEFLFNASRRNLSVYHPAILHLRRYRQDLHAVINEPEFYGV